MFTILFFLICGIPIISNAAGIYDNSLRNIDKKKNEKLENIRANETNILNGNIDKISSEYDVELLSILKKNTMIQKIQDKAVSNQQHFSMDAGISDIQFISNDGIDAQILLETKMVWKEIKADLNQPDIFFNKIDIWTKSFLDEYLDEHIDINYVLNADANIVMQPKRKLNLYKNKNMLSNMIYQNDTQYKHRNTYEVSSGYNDELNSAYGDNDDETNMLSFIYLWKKYSDVIVGVMVITILWLVITSLIKFLMRAG